MNKETFFTNLEKRGTAIVGFTYNGKARNVVFGENLARHGHAGERAWGRHLSKNVIEHLGRKYVQGIVNNEGERRVKCFALDKIEDIHYKGERVGV